MTLNEALAISGANHAAGEKKIHYLVCGFEPLHLETFFRAHLLNCVPETAIEVRHGLYGDLSGNLALAAESAAIAAAVVIEWSDIDPRLGLRSSGGWGITKADIVASARHRYSTLEVAIARVAARMPLAVAAPALPLPPIGNTIGAQSSVFELELRQDLAAFLLRLAKLPGVRIAEPPVETQRLDARMELIAGFPYTLPFADRLAHILASVLYQPVPKKGLITDLDDTLWSGLVGEAGVDGVSWHQDSHTQIHGLYQQMLGHLAECGVLLAICSKNELAIVERALARPDLMAPAAGIFPVCANWGPKSASVAIVLQAWNIGADSVVFIDDNPMELEEVRRAFPAITCLQFPVKNPAKAWTLMGELRDLFGKPLVHDEDRLRLASLRASAEIGEMGASAGSPEFLQSLNGTVTLAWGVDAADKRPLELVNKTNQFNLNGIRFGEGEWQRLIEETNSIVTVISYADKFGPLGKVGVLVGSHSGALVRVSQWVLSCRAFSRSIEQHTLEALFRRTHAEEIEFAFQATDKNQPLQEFFRAIAIQPGPEGKYRISRSAFVAQATVLPHRISELTQ